MEEHGRGTDRRIERLRENLKIRLKMPQKMKKERRFGEIIKIGRRKNEAKARKPIFAGRCRRSGLQCDQIGRFCTTWVTFSTPWQLPLEKVA